MVENLPAMQGSIPGSGRSAREGNGYTPVFLPGEFHGQRNQAGFYYTVSSVSFEGLSLTFARSEMFLRKGTKVSFQVRILNSIWSNGSFCR